MLTNQDDLAIVQGVIGLAEVFGRSVIAEGVETEAHSAKLLSMNCEEGQGYGIAQPMPAADLPQWLKGWHANPT
jgi:EAL domain-containing protein (putative c-di-GMP-specific phosphodiesterase class I)